MKKALAGTMNQAFISQLGRHNTLSLGKDVGINDAIKLAKSAENSNTLNDKDHNDMHTILSTITGLTNGPGMKFGEKLIATTIESAMSNLTNSTKNQISSLSMFSNVSKLGKNDSTYTKLICHVGKPTTKKLKKQLNAPNISVNVRSALPSLPASFSVVMDK